MHRFPLKPLSALICCALMGSAWAGESPGRVSTSLSMDRLREASGIQGASNFVNTEPDPFSPFSQEEAEAEGKDDEALKLKIARKLVPLSAESTDTHPAFIIADQIEGRQDESTQATGNVELRKVGNLLWADTMNYSPLDDEVEAIGRVRYERDQDIITGDYLKLRMADQVGHMDRPEYLIQRQVKRRGWGATNVPVLPGLELDLPKTKAVTGYGEAERIHFEGENRVSVDNGTYTACKPGDRDWYTKAQKMHLDYDANLGKAHDAKVYFKDVPILYSPTLSFALNNERTSGLLPPTWVTSTRTGLDLTLPYYWNIAPNYDATLYPRMMSKRGLQLGTQFRYLDPYSNGVLKFEVMPQDKVFGSSRHAYSWVHNHLNLGKGFSGTINWNGVSDDNYWTDLSSRLVQTSQVHLPKQATLNYASGSWWNLSSTLLSYQTLQADKNNPIARPYFLQPQLNLTGRLPDFYGMDFSLGGQYSAFSHPTWIQGQRVVAYPQLAMPFVKPGYYFTPKFGAHLSQYSLNQISDGTPSTQSRVVPVFSVDSGLVFERDTQWLGRAYTQTLEPRLFYVNVPYQNQSKIPIFDTGIADFNFAQIFSENRYVGNDRFSDASQLTAAITSRFIDPATGGERFKAMVGQRHYFRPQRVTMPGETASTDKFSTILGAFSGNILPRTYLDMAVEYDQALGTTRRFNVGGRYQPEVGKAFSASYRRTQGQLEQIDLAAQWPVRGGWYAVGRYNYSFRDSRLIEAIAGFEYKAGCWVSRFVTQRLQSVGGTSVTSLFYQLELNDFARIGTSPIQMLRRSVPGYGPINDLSDTSESTLLSSDTDSE